MYRKSVITDIISIIFVYIKDNLNSAALLTRFKTWRYKRQTNSSTCNKNEFNDPQNKANIQIYFTLSINFLINYIEVQILYKQQTSMTALPRLREPRQPTSLSDSHLK